MLGMILDFFPSFSSFAFFASSAFFLSALDHGSVSSTRILAELCPTLEHKVVGQNKKERERELALYST